MQVDTLRKLDDELPDDTWDWVDDWQANPTRSPALALAGTPVGPCGTHTHTHTARHVSDNAMGAHGGCEMLTHTPTPNANPKQPRPVQSITASYPYP